MGVHVDAEVYEQVKALLGIPADEPIFILRAQDEFSESLISKYGWDYRMMAQRRNMAKNPEAGTQLTPEQKKFHQEVQKCADEFWTWQQENDAKVKFPD